MGKTRQGFGNQQLVLEISKFRGHYLHCDTSNHCPLLINLLGLDPPPKKKIFSFEETWLSNARCGETVETSWNSWGNGGEDSVILAKIKECGKDLMWWSHNYFGNV